MSLLGFQSDSAQHQKLLTGHFGGSAPGELCIQDFLESDLQLPRCREQADTSHSHAEPRNSAGGVLFPSIHRIVGGICSLSARCSAPDGYLGNVVDMVLSIYFRPLRTVALPGRSARNPGECTQLLKKIEEFVL